MLLINNLSPGHACLGLVITNIIKIMVKEDEKFYIMINDSSHCVYFCYSAPYPQPQNRTRLLRQTGHNLK